ncbi:hypothetical protein SAMN04490357_0379 [Streptomyces misionensis]|uniref:Uncharacterized protein n=1 Tax=Streptomyces misionensis TaxID=67331 RepID=A0A1H4M5Z1_9ACTN|nr:hypothetical protein [Streptomyces misionensis]SEB78416.1 hypothetical protein SAMN04490357_0379 [Streptomyces misionensis]
MLIVIAMLLLPALALLLVVMDRVEDWLPAASSGPRHTRGRRHLRLVPGEVSDSPSRPATVEAPERRAHAA